jgi:hypothetical protein
VTTAPAVDLLGTAMVDFAAGRRPPVWLRVGSGRRLAHDLAAYFAPVTEHERALLDLVEGPVLDVGCGPARHARFLQAAGLTAIGLDRSALASASPGRSGCATGCTPTPALACCRRSARRSSSTATLGSPRHRTTPCGSFTAWP